MQTLADRLRAARKRAGFESARQAALNFDWKPSTYAGHENGERVPRRSRGRIYARAFGVSAKWLLDGEGSPTSDRLSVPVVGLVGAGSTIIPPDDADPIDELSLPASTPNLVAVQVSGTSQYPRYLNGEFILYSADDARPPQELIGKECVLRLKDGRMYIKILRRGTRAGLYSLDSWNAPPLEDEEIDWATPVQWRRS